MKTKIVILIITGAAIIANIVLLATGNNSISATIQALSGKYPVIPLAIGVCCGHWFWPVGGLTNKEE